MSHRSQKHDTHFVCTGADDEEGDNDDDNDKSHGDGNVYLDQNANARTIPAYTSHLHHVAEEQPQTS